MKWALQFRITCPHRGFYMLSEDEIRRKLAEKFNSFESEPQDESWEKIRAAMHLSQLFQDYEAEPHEESWEKIRAGIDFTQRMNEYEPEPKEESWDKIRAGVDLAHKFKDYEADPQAISWLKIQEGIQPKKRRRGIIPLFFRAGLAAGVILLLGSLWWVLNKQENAAPTANNSSGKKSNTGVTKPSTKNADKTLNAGSDTNIAGNTQSKTSLENGVVTPSNPSPLATAPKGGINKPKVKSETQIAGTKTIKGLHTDKQVGSANQSNEVLAYTTATKQIQLQPEAMQGKTFHQKPIRKPFNAIAYNTEKPYQEKQQRVHRAIVFNASLMPLQTYQAFTVLPQTNTYIQQVGRLDAIDNQRLGIQLRAGAMKPLSNRFAMGLSAAYTGVQQWANYELNNGEYEVQTADNGSYTLVGIGELVSQKQFLQTVGLKLDNAYLVSRKKNAVYAIAGAEAVHVLNNKDFGYYVNASVGVSYPIKGGKSLWIEPTFRYSLSQSADANNYLKIRPYNIGLNLRVNFI